MNPDVLALGDDNFQAEVLASDRPTLVDFYTQHCAPCRALAPTITALAEAHRGRVKVGTLDVDASRTVAARFGRALE